MAHCGGASTGQPRAHETQCCDESRLAENRCGKRTAQQEHHAINDLGHDCLFLSLRTRSISAWSATNSSSLKRDSVIRAVNISCREPPKKVCRYRCSAVRLAAVGEAVAE